MNQIHQFTHSSIQTLISSREAETRGREGLALVLHQVSGCHITASASNSQALHLMLVLLSIASVHPSLPPPPAVD